MKRNSHLFFLPVVVLFCSTAIAEDSGIDGCIEKIKKARKGEIVKIESLSLGDKLFYEAEIKNDQNDKWDITCDAASFEIIEIEEKVSSSDSNSFRKNAKLSENDAIKIALNTQPGKIVDIEYEIKDNGTPIFEIDISRKDGKEAKVEVNAVSGNADAGLIEKWEIGGD